MVEKKPKRKYVRRAKPELPLEPPAPPPPSSILLPSAEAFVLRQWCDRHGWQDRVLVNLLAGVAYSWFERAVPTWTDWPARAGSREAPNNPVEVGCDWGAVESLDVLCARIGVPTWVPIIECYHRLRPWLAKCPWSREGSLNRTFSAFVATQRNAIQAIEKASATS